MRRTTAFVRHEPARERRDCGIEARLRSLPILRALGPSRRPRRAVGRWSPSQRCIPRRSPPMDGVHSRPHRRLGADGAAVGLRRPRSAYLRWMRVGDVGASGKDRHQRRCDEVRRIRQLILAVVRVASTTARPGDSARVSRRRARRAPSPASPSPRRRRQDLADSVVQRGIGREDPPTEEPVVSALEVRDTAARLHRDQSARSHVPR